jgi:hypothetical protein
MALWSTPYFPAVPSGCRSVGSRKALVCEPFAPPMW